MRLLPTDRAGVMPTGVDRRRLGLWLAAGMAALSLIGSAASRAADWTSLAPEIRSIKSRGKLLVGMTEFD